MSTPRFYCDMPLPNGHRIALPDTVARHAVGVLRLREGATVILFNGNGQESTGKLFKSGRGAEVELLSSHLHNRESSLDVTLVQGISSGERMDYTLQKAVELGVSRIQPIIMKRTIVRLDDEKRQKRRRHWQGVVIGTCEQSGRNSLPEVMPLREFAEWLPNHAQFGQGFLLDPEGGMRLRSLPAPEAPLFLLAGPEGGFDPDERRLAISKGLQPLCLGPRILRTETAAVAALAAMQALWGDL